MLSIVTELGNPVHLRLYIVEDPPVNALYPHAVSGWSFIAEEVDLSGQPTPIFDAWDETWEGIVRYAHKFKAESVPWRNTDTGSVVHLPEILGMRGHIAP